MRLALGLLIGSFAVCGCGGGGGSGSAGGTSTGSGPAGGTAVSGTAPMLKQMNTYQTTNAVGENNSSVQFKTPTAKGNTLWVVATVPTYGGVHTIAVTDSQGNAYTLLSQADDTATGATQSVAQFYAANIAGDGAVPDTIMVTWGYDNYKGILITEISGTTAAPLVGAVKAIQDGLTAGSPTVTAGPITVASAQTPGLLVAVSMNTSGGISDVGGSNFPGPTAGSGMTPVATFWDWGQNLGTFATAGVTSAESISSVFTAPDTADSYVTVATVFH